MRCIKVNEHFPVAGTIEQGAFLSLWSFGFLTRVLLDKKLAERGSLNALLGHVARVV